MVARDSYYAKLVAALQPCCILVVGIHCIKFGGEMSISGIFSGKLSVAKVVARDSYNANMVAA